MTIYKMKLLTVQYLGFTAMDRRFSGPMLPWIVSEIRKRDSYEQVQAWIFDVMPVYLFSTLWDKQKHLNVFVDRQKTVEKYVNVKTSFYANNEVFKYS